MREKNEIKKGRLEKEMKEDEKGKKPKANEKNQKIGWGSKMMRIFLKSF